VVTEQGSGQAVAELAARKSAAGCSSAFQSGNSCFLTRMRLSRSGERSLLLWRLWLGRVGKGSAARLLSDPARLFGQGHSGRWAQD
jgi:hypothetical protein